MRNWRVSCDVPSKSSEKLGVRPGPIPDAPLLMDGVNGDCSVEGASTAPFRPRHHVKGFDSINRGFEATSPVLIQHDQRVVESTVGCRKEEATLRVVIGSQRSSGFAERVIDVGFREGRLDVHFAGERPGRCAGTEEGDHNLIHHFGQPGSSGFSKPSGPPPLPPRRWC